MRLPIATGAIVTLALSAGVLISCSSESTDPSRPSESRELATTIQDLAEQARSELPVLRQIAAEHAAKLEGRPADTFQVEGGVVTSLPHAKRVLARFKISGLDAPSRVDIDVATGEPIADGEDLVQEELKAARKARHKLSPSLKRRLDASGSEPVQVAIWLRSESDPSARPLRTSVGRGVTFQGNAVAKSAAFDRASRTAPVRERMLKSLASVDANASVHSTSPIAYATVPRSYIATLQASEDVVDIDVQRSDYTNSLDVVKDTLDYAPEVHTNYGYDGTGQKIGVIEWGSDSRVASHTCLDQITQDSGGTAALHPTGVVGVIACSDATNTGVAPDAQIWEREVDEQTEVESAVADALAWGARITNMSYGAPGSTPEVDDRFVDDQVWTHWITAVVAAGNAGTESSYEVRHPGLGYNAFTVGNFDDKNTVSRSDDSMRSTSCYVDPTSTNNDREKPEVAGPGTSIKLPNTSGGYTSQTGTSFAAPAVAGTAALMMEAEPSLQYWPEIIKAAIMASARYNIEGDSRLSDKDGAGGMNTKDAVDIVRPGGPANSNYSGDGVSCDSSFPRDYTLSLTAGKKTRAVIVWDQDPNYEYYASQPGADLDLDILKPDGSFLVRSNSYDNTYEIVEFTPPSTGTYTARVTMWRCDASPAAIGFAWFQDP